MNATKKRVLEIVDFYSLSEGMAYIEKGGDQLPLHHLWCYDKLRKWGYDMQYLDYDKNSNLSKLGRKIGLPNLEQQINVIKKRKEYDVVFDPFMQFSILMAFLKLIGLFDKPILSIAQRAYIVNKKNPLKRFKQYILRYIYFKNVDKIIFINDLLANESSKYKPLGNTDYLKSWGVENEFFESFAKEQTSPPAEDYIYSTGGSERDFETLISAFHDIDFKLRITSRSDFSDELKCGVPSNVVIDNSIPPSLTSTGKLRKEYYNALAVALPINRHPYFFCPYGNTVLFEAMASGKPVIATDNKAFPFNIEKEGIGLLVDYNDVEGWKQAVRYLIDHPDKVREMGERGLHLCKTKYNYQLFSKEIFNHLGEVINKTEVEL